MARYVILQKREQENMSKDMAFCRSRDVFHGKQLLKTATKTGLDALKIASKK